MLAQRGLAQAHGLLQRADRTFALGQLAQDQQALGIGNQGQPPGHMIGTLLQGVGRLVEIHYISID